MHLHRIFRDRVVLETFNKEMMKIVDVYSSCKLRTVIKTKIHRFQNKVGQNQTTVLSA